jgi:UDP-N-acetylmuramoyl-L-alanyl-D-glutamate--2,6-diaminopimelate ligase
MQFAGTTAKGAQILIDYAHTPDAVENILKAIAPEVCGKLWIIIGCGGNRDPLKRPLMGAIASKFADQVIVTDDNPRWEDPASIRAQVLEGATNAKEIGNRLDAIAYAIDKMENEDLLIIAGKGHETQQIIRDQIIPFNDLDVVQTILRGQQ